MISTQKLDNIRWFAQHRPEAHQLFFAHRHREESPAFHRDIINFLHSNYVYGVVLAFRGAAKSTLVEEDIILDACLAPIAHLLKIPTFHNCVIVGASEKRAIERLQAIKVEFENNEQLREHFGDQVGVPWQETKIVLKNGVIIQAIGRDQAVRGVKHGDWRPDRIIVDDVEERENVQTPEGRRKTMTWLVAELLPAADVNYRIRILATPMDKESVPQRLIDDVGWPKLVIPIETKGEDGERKATWPSRFPLETIDKLMVTYRLTGTMHIWDAEMMCQARAEADRVFRQEYFRQHNHARSYHAVFAMIDPARSMNPNAATTGWAVWSWLGNRLHVWAAGAKQMLPDEIIDLMFTLNREWEPTCIYVEEDGLNEWLKQPIRHEQVKRRTALPFAPLKAPKNKFGFIRGLQPLYQAGEVSHQRQLPELETQLVSFPSGNIDAPNALAYAQMTRPVPVYENWSDECVSDDPLIPFTDRPLYVVANANATTTAAILCQFADEQLFVYRDWIVEGDPAETVAGIHTDATLEGDAIWGESERPRDWMEALKSPMRRMTLRHDPPKWVVPPHHANEWNNVGLIQSIRRVPATAARGTVESAGRVRLGTLLSHLRHSRAALVIDARATWTLRAFAGGYARQVRSNGALTDEAERNIYRLLMEGLESFVGMTQPRDEGRDDAQPIAYNRFGHAYKSAMPQRGRLH